jgi:hypothetical protein
MPPRQQTEAQELAEKLNDMLGKVNYMLVDLKAISIKFRDWKFVSSLLEACIALTNLLRLTLKELLDHIGIEHGYTEIKHTED